MPADPSLISVLTAWSFEPSIMLGLLVTGAIYLAGLHQLARRGRLWHSVTRWHAASFWLGLLAILVALESPIDVLNDRLFTLHMAQHLLLLMVAPPLLLLGKPIPVLLVGAPHELVRGVTRLHARRAWLHGLTRSLTSPLVAWPLYIGDILLWHAPALYQAALSSEGVHLLEHLCFLGTGLLFWWVIIEPLPGPARLHHGLRLLYAWAAVLPTTALGALFVFSGSPWYPVYASAPRLFGLSVLDDQRLAGLVMWLPGDMMYVGAATFLFFAMMARDERAVEDAVG